MQHRVGPKRVRSLQINEFSYADRRLRRAAFHGFIPLVLIGGLEADNPHVIAIGHPDGIADPNSIPKSSRYYSTIRIRGVGTPEEALVSGSKRSAGG